MKPGAPGAALAGQELLHHCFYMAHTSMAYCLHAHVWHEIMDVYRSWMCKYKHAVLQAFLC